MRTVKAVCDRILFMDEKVSTSNRNIIWTTGKAGQQWHLCGDDFIQETYLVGSDIIGKVGKKAGNTHISQDGGKYW